jgi:hypothetical protein
MSDMYYARGQGKVYFAPRDANGQTGGFTWIGDADQFSVQGTQETLEFRESYSGLRAKVIDTITSTDLSFTLQMRDFDADNLARAFYGTNTAGAGAVVSGETFNAYAGTSYFTKHPGISAVTATKGATPLVLNTDYTLDATTGELKFLPASSIITGAGAHACTVNYTYAAYTGKVQALVSDPKNFVVKFVGKDQDNRAMQVTLHNARPSIPADVQLIGTEVGALTLTGGLQIAGEITGAGLSKFMEIVRG